MNRKKLLQGTSAETFGKLGEFHLLRELALQAGDLIVWLFVLEHRAWPNWNKVSRQELFKRYLVEYWAYGDEVLKGHLASLEEGEERDRFVNKLSQIHAAAQPFIAYHKRREAREKQGENHA